MAEKSRFIQPDISVKNAHQSAPADLTLLVDTKKIYSIDNYYDKYRILQVLNKENNLNLKINDVIFTKFTKSAITIVGNEETGKYKGTIVINYKVDKHIPFIIWIAITIALFIVGLAVLLPIGLVRIQDNSSEIGVLVASAVVIAIAYISTLVCLRLWPNELTRKQKAKLE